MAESFSRDYKKELNFKITKTYDDKIKSLIYHLNHCKIYQFDNESSDWQFLSCQGPLVLYERELTITDNGYEPLGENEFEDGFDVNQLSGKDGYKYGLLVFNRLEPINFSLGISNDSAFIQKQVEENGESAFNEMKVDLKEELVILKSHLNEVFGIWIEETEEREAVYQLLKAFISKQE
ncbi:hypothetical protein ACO0SA_003893 [Hanseniaspora valbyensis]